MFRLFRNPPEQKTSPSLLSKVIETAKELHELSPVEFTRPSFSNLANNSILLLSFATNTAASLVCFKKDDIPYSFECQEFFNGYDLQGNLLNILNQTSDIILTTAQDCLYYRNDHEYFGSSGYGKPLCDLGYPRLMVPDSGIISNLRNNTPTHKFGTVEDANTTFLISGVGLVGISFFVGGACALARHLKSKNTNDVEINEATSLNPNNPSCNR